MNQQIDKGSAEPGKLLGEVLGNTLGGDLAEDQHQDSHYHRGDGSAHIAVKLHKQQSANGGHGNVHDIVADQDGGNQLVIVFRQAVGQLGPAVTAVRQPLQTDGIQRRKSRFSGRKVRGHQDTEHHNQDAWQFIG